MREPDGFATYGWLCLCCMRHQFEKGEPYWNHSLWPEHCRECQAIIEKRPAARGDLLVTSRSVKRRKPKVEPEVVSAIVAHITKRGNAA